PRAAEACDAEAGRIFDCFFGPGYFGANLFFRIEVEPGLMMKRMIGNFVTGFRDRAQDATVSWKSCILTNYEERDMELVLLQKLQYPWNHDFQVARMAFPAFIAMCLQVSPLVVQIKRDTGDREFIRRGHSTSGLPDGRVVPSR